MRLGLGSVPLVWFLMQDAAPVTLFALGFGLCGAIFTLSDRLATLEARVKVIRRAKDRR